MDDTFVLLCATNVVEVQRVKVLLEENGIFPIIKDESESRKYNWTPLRSMLVVL